MRFETIGIGNPTDGYHALMVARQPGDGACAVTDEEAEHNSSWLCQSGENEYHYDTWRIVRYGKL